MIELNRITDKQDSRLDQIIDLYVAAFPEEERRDLNQLRLLIEQADNMYLNAIEANNTLCGFFIYWDMGGFYYLEH
ncbi:MAG: GNAT family N-acetyltransferase, partial [Tannerellaceae bacterium]